MNEIRYRHLTMDSNGYTQLLGETLPLTHTQSRIVCKLIEAAPDPVTVIELSETCLNTQGTGQVPVQVHAINKIALKITGRKLIMNQRNVGYYLNIWM